MKKKWFLYSLIGILLCIILGAAAWLHWPPQWSEENTATKQTISYNGEEYRYKEELVNLLFVGIDQRVPIEQVNHGYYDGFADMILLVTMDTKQKHCQLTVIPRDIVTPVFWFDNDGNITGGDLTQLTWQYVLGDTPEECGALMKHAVSTLLHQLPIHRYCTLNYDTVNVLNDMIDGVEVEVLEDLTWVHPIFEQGTTIHLAGELARLYVGVRNTDIAKSNLTRLERQKQYMTAYFEKLPSAVFKNPFLFFEPYEELQGDMSTDLSVREMAYLANILLQLDMSRFDIKQISGEQVSGDIFEEFYPDEKALEEFVITTFFEKVSR